MTSLEMPETTSPVVEFAEEIPFERLKSNDKTPGKKRRSRKGLVKRFKCMVEASDHVFVCAYHGCARNFVRADLLKRHMNRHATKGVQIPVYDDKLGKQSQLSISQVTPSSSEPYAGILAGESVPTQSQSFAPQDVCQRSQSPIGNKPLNTRQDVIPSLPDVVNGLSGHAVCRLAQTPSQIHFMPCNNPLTASAGSAHSQLYHNSSSSHDETSQSKPGFVTYPGVVSLDLPQTEYTSSRSEISSHLAQHLVPQAQSQQFRQTTQNQDADMTGLEKVAISSVGPVFGDDGVPSKSPHIEMPEDFMAYLFNSMPAHGSHTEHGFHGSSLNYGELQDMQYLTAPFMTNNTGVLTYVSTASQRIMSVTNLLDGNSPETNISEHRSQEVFEFIRDRFYEQEVPVTERRRENIIGGDRVNDDHMLSRHMMQAYLVSYWYHFSDQIPILHRPSFSSEKAPILLLLGMITIGASCLDGTFGQDVIDAGAELASFIARHLRWEIFMDTNFRPPSKLWVFQALILLEIYEKLFSTRELHERAHIHHATTITLMRRGRCLMGKWMESPLHQKAGLDGTKQGTGTDTGKQSPEDWWSHWIMNESTRRAAFAAFIIDSTHATMFGHSAVMATHEIRLPLPCDESLWRAKSSTEVVRANARLNSLGIRPISFLEGLKRTLSHQEVRTSTFGRTALMAGLMSVTYHLKQRDLQVNMLGGRVIEASAGRDKWREALTRAYDWWKSDFDQRMRDDEPQNDPYAQHNARIEAHTAFDSRIVLHHMAHMAMDTDFIDCQIFARAKRLFGRTIRPRELSNAQRRVKEQWAPSAKARNATLSAFRLLSSVLLPNGSASTNASGSWPKGIYSTRHDVLINRPWVLYFAALVVWCYGYAVEGPCGKRGEMWSLNENHRQMQAYLSTYASVKDANDFQFMRGVNNNTALLIVLRDAFDKTKWDLLQEGAHLMRNCIILNEGGTVA
ncbi:hypothetical protein E4U42_002623 [Claviceps africana]|uniref:C2H2-type domain-containing protein n=1 Tax=Claviceps africana TaxID=83212 RepID=A0A8K0JIG4_9HYPO|nr:hypothetical protein E4U42_002623 [Claviceps africana]